jgi:hypothetical protein
MNVSLGKTHFLHFWMIEGSPPFSPSAQPAGRTVAGDCLRYQQRRFSRDRVAQGGKGGKGGGSDAPFIFSPRIISFGSH